MRMRKKKWADPYLEEHSDYALMDPKDLRGRWSEVLGRTEIHVEIGTGKGDYMNAMASMYPDTAWIGIEKDHSAAAIAVRKAIESGEDLDRKRMIVGDAEHLLDWFAEGEADVIHLNFSDPWPKTRYHKRRLSSRTFLEMYKVILTPGGSIRMKKDNQDLFAASVLYFLKNGFTLKEFSVNYRRKPHGEDAVTEYEQRFMELGMPVYQLAAYPKHD